MLSVFWCWRGVLLELNMRESTIAGWTIKSWQPAAPEICMIHPNIFKLSSGAHLRKKSNVIGTNTSQPYRTQLHSSNTGSDGVCVAFQWTPQFSVKYKLSARLLHKLLYQGSRQRRPGTLPAFLYSVAGSWLAAPRTTPDNVRLMIKNTWCCIERHRWICTYLFSARACQARWFDKTLSMINDESRCRQQMHEFFEVGGISRPNATTIIMDPGGALG